MRVVMECPRCGQENARALLHCWACGEWLHGTSPVVGVCPHCRLPVRESELVCANCGFYLDPELKEQGGPRLPEEKRPRARAKKVVARLAQPVARVSFGAFVCRLLGAALLIIAVGRGILTAEAYMTAITPDEALFTVYAAVLWLVVGITGLILLAIGFFVLRPAS